ncbi:cobalamin biosynthesis protein CobD/CbiB [Motilimonas pumila]|nr:cobalamin biosynthesis protein [Motilimonas pumila]
MSELSLSFLPQLAFLAAVMCSMFINLPQTLHPMNLAHLGLQILGNKVANPSHSQSQQKVAGLLALLVVCVPSLALMIALQQVVFFPGLLEFVVLLCMLEWRGVVKRFDRVREHCVIVNKTQARNHLNDITLREVDGLSLLGIQKAATESLTLQLSGRWFFVVFWYLVGGIYAALLCRIMQLCAYSWNQKKHRYHAFGTWPRQLYGVLAWLPNLALSLTLLCYGNTLYGLKNVFRQGATWPLFSSGLVLSAMASSLQIQLGGLRVYETIQMRFALVGTGQSIQVQHLDKVKQRLKQAAWFWLIAYCLVHISWWLITQNAPTDLSPLDFPSNQYSPL